ncbi:hypothetical protein, partial [Variovorax rhizosphaerae]
TMRTARSMTSGENFGDFLILAPFSIEGASSKSGAVQSVATRKELIEACPEPLSSGAEPGNQWRRQRRPCKAFSFADASAAGPVPRLARAERQR